MTDIAKDIFKLKIYLYTLRFTEEHSEGDGWIMKLPYRTNSEAIRYPKTFQKLMKEYKGISRRNYGTIEYVMIQPMLANKYEYKVTYPFMKWI